MPLHPILYQYRKIANQPSITYSSPLQLLTLYAVHFAITSTTKRRHMSPKASQIGPWSMPNKGRLDHIIMALLLWAPIWPPPAPPPHHKISGAPTATNVHFPSTMLLPHLRRSLVTCPSLSSSSRYHRRAVMSAAAVNFSGDGGRGGGGRTTLRGVVFDMDGTLTVPVIDFAAMYRAVLGDEGLAAARAASPSGSVDILHHIETWAPLEQQKAYEIIAHFERQGLDRLQIMPGAIELCEYLDSNKIRRGLITRNIKAAVDLFHQRFGMKFIPALSREFRPYKPDPAPLLHICSTWGIRPSEVMMIGDSPRDDVVCGKRAGAFTCLLDETGRYCSPESLTDDQKPDFKVSSLIEVQSLLETHFDLVPQSLIG